MINMGGPALIEGGWTSYDDTQGFTFTPEAKVGKFDKLGDPVSIPIGNKFTAELYNTELWHRQNLELEFIVGSGLPYMLTLYLMESHYDDYPTDMRSFIINVDGKDRKL